MELACCALLLLLAVATSAAPHVIWTEFSPNRKVSGVRHATGYPIEVLEYAWEKYGSALIRAVAHQPTRASRWCSPVLGIGVYTY